jgi:hypothetical protein
VHLVVDQVVQLQHVHVADGDLALEGSPVRPSYSTWVWPREAGQVRPAPACGLDLGLVAPSNTGVANGTPLGRLPPARPLLVAQARCLPACRRRCRSCRGTCALRRPWPACRSIAPIFRPRPLRGPAEVGLENLADVHPRRHAQRVQHDVHRRAVGHVRHVFDRDDLGDHALVAVAAGHLVAGLQAALHGQVDLDHLLHARRQFVALGQLLLLRFEATSKSLRVLSSCRAGFPAGALQHPRRRADVEPV